jgi:hypothetical protein
MARSSIVLASLFLSALVFAHASHAHSAGMTEGPASHHLGNGSFADATYLIELKQGSYLSALASRLGNGGFETATGNRIDFRDWYSNRFTDASVVWMTLVSPNFGVIHGFSTGERGSKYLIAPALKLGLTMQTMTGRNAVLSFRATTTIGGELREKPCSADYGEIGGVQVVNCRLAATPLPPAQTLDYLVREKPLDRHQVSVRFSWRF